MTKIWSGPTLGWAYLVYSASLSAVRVKRVIDCCTREILSWSLSHRCRTEEALEAVEQVVLARLPAVQPGGCTAWESRIDARPIITRRATVISNGFHRLKEEQAWTAEYRNVHEARASIAHWIKEYNHDRPHRGVQNRPARSVLGLKLT
jgi:transposase InsO family protein